MEKLLNPVKKILRLDIDNFKMIEANFYHTPYFDFLNQFDSKKLFHASIDHLKNIHKQRLLHLFHLIDRIEISPPLIPSSLLLQEELYLVKSISHSFVTNPP